MLLVGAGGHAREVFDVLKSEYDVLYFFDSISQSLPMGVRSEQWLRTDQEVRSLFSQDNRFVIAVGGTQTRKQLCEHVEGLGGKSVTCVASSAVVSKERVDIGAGCNIMHQAFISCDTRVGKGSLVNTRVNIHHDVEVGSFCEIGPAAVLLGRVKLGMGVFIGAGAVILPGISIGDYAVVGAGAVVTKNVASNATVKGIPAQ